MNRRMDHVLVVDDDVELCALVQEYLTAEGFSLKAVHDGEQGLQQALTNDYSLVVLDVMLPGINGFEVLRRIRSVSKIPVLLLTARSEDTDRIVGLEIGADDYLPKPCNPRELLARVRAVLRRRQEPKAVEEHHGGVLEFAGWRLDLVRRELKTPQGVGINLSSGEFSLV